MSDDYDERYASSRAFADLDKKHSVLDATVSGQLQRMGSDLSEIKMLVMRSPASPQSDHWQLTAQRAMDMLEKRNAPGGSNLGITILVGLALFGVGVTCFCVGKFIF